ncbi:MAG: hypothetical protein WC512_04925 [Candidatus Omnitrophota bacterium]
MLKTVRILNLDGSVIRQKRLMETFKPEIVDLEALGPKCRLYSSEDTAREIRERLKGKEKDAVSFIGSGDFHHVTGLLLDGFEEDISVISFDYHPDWDIMPPKIGCGSWVTRVLNRENVKKLILLGVSSGDISPSLFQTGNFEALKNDRVEIYPYKHKNTRLFLKRVPANISVGVRRGLFYDELRWQELKDKNIAEFFLHVLRRLPAKKVYVTIDKDCLKSDFALTNWEEGYFGLDELLLMLKFIKENTEIAGLDITGEYSPVKAEGFVRTAAIDIDHPRAFSARGKSAELIDRINEETNMRILELLLG